jgi:hypothetical protein
MPLCELLQADVAPVGQYALCADGLDPPPRPSGMWEVDVIDSLGAARDEILVENTAQAVFKHLERLETVRTRIGARWVWELLQNARDAAGSDGVCVEIDVSGEQVRFRHNGRSFTEKELAHLIYHGSTKVAESESDLVHFGSGFLSTHLLSRHVTVTGTLTQPNGLRGFQFLLDRSGHTVEALNDSMQRTWGEFRASLESASLEEDRDGPQTEFTYALDNNGRELVLTGLAQLKMFAALTLAFSHDIRRVTVRSPQDTWEIERAEATDGHDKVAIHRFEVSSTDDNGPQFVAIAGDESVQVALPLRGREGALSIDLPKWTPRLFVLFPLLTTDRLSLPVIVNSREFVPLEDRDGMPLEGESARSAGNRAILERAFPFAQSLLEVAATQRWEMAETLLSLSAVALPDWVSRDWARSLLLRYLNHLRGLPLVETACDSRIAPRDAAIPHGDKEWVRSEIWELTSHLSELSARLPSREQLQPWADNLASWVELQGDRLDLPELLDVSALASIASTAVRVDALSTSLDPDQAMRWFVKLAHLVAANGSSSLFDSHAFLPSEAGCLHRRSELEVDSGIGEPLKEVADALGLDLRDRLAGPGLAAGDMEGLFSPLSELGAVEEVLNHYLSLMSDGGLPIGNVRASASLFRWLSRSDEHRSRLDGLQVCSSDSVDGRFTMITLDADAAQPPLAPTSLWRDGARVHCELFPRRRILHPAYADDGTEPEWQVLARVGLITLDPLALRKRRLSAFVSSSGVIESDGEDNDVHRSPAAVDSTDIAFLEEPDIGLIDQARHSRTKARELLRFVLCYAGVQDAAAFDELQRECECGEEHPSFRAGWLVPLRRRKWLPAADGSRHSLNVDAEGLATIVREVPDLIGAFATELGDKVLRAWGVSPSDFQLRVIADSEEDRKSLVVAVGRLARVSGGVARLEALAQEIEEHPEFLSQIESRRQERDDVARNQRIGEMVEQLLKNELIADGINVVRTGVGSDFALGVEDGSGVVLEVCDGVATMLIEVKSTHRDYVRMTPRQALTATENGDNYCLCVVELGDAIPTAESVRTHSRFVFDIASRLTAPWSTYEAYESVTAAARTGVGQEVVVDIEEGQVRFRVGRQVWEDSATFSDAVERVKRSGS